MYGLFYFTGGVIAATALFSAVLVWVLFRWGRVLREKNRTIEELEGNVDLERAARRCAVDTLRERDGRSCQVVAL